MGKKEKLINKLLALPKDFTFEEAETLLTALGFVKSKKGKTSGSRVRFRKGNVIIDLHKPHPRKDLLTYQLKDIIQHLKEADLI